VATRSATPPSGGGNAAVSNRSAERDTTRDVALQNARVAKLLGEFAEAGGEGSVAGRPEARRTGGRTGTRTGGALRGDCGRRLGRGPDRRGECRDLGAGLPHFTRSPSRAFDLRQEPYTIVANVSMPAPPDSATLQVKVLVDPIPIVARVTCADVGSEAREASVSVETPAWVRVQLGTVSQTPDVCARSRAGESLLHWPRLATRRLLLGVGRAWGVDRQGRWAVFIGTGIAL
jgi:hypothetical protein